MDEKPGTLPPCAPAVDDRVFEVEDLACPIDAPDLFGLTLATEQHDGPPRPVCFVKQPTHDDPKSMPRNTLRVSALVE